MPLGTPLSKFVYDAGGGTAPGHSVKAVQTGGPSGGCIPHNMLDTPVDFESLGKLGSIMGSGGMVVMDDDNCMVDVARYFIEFTRSESCGKCTPCSVGLDKALRTLTRITKGEGREEDLARTGRTGPDDPRHVALRSRPIGAELRAYRAAPLSPRIRGPHPREALPRRRLSGSGTRALREQLPAAHEHSALPAALQGRSDWRTRSNRSSWTTRCRLPPAASASIPARAAAAGRRWTSRSTCARCIASSPIPSCCRTSSTRWRPRSSPSGFRQPGKGSPWSALVRQD